MKKYKDSGDIFGLFEFKLPYRLKISVEPISSLTIFKTVCVYVLCTSPSLNNSLTKASSSVVSLNFAINMASNSPVTS